MTTAAVLEARPDPVADAEAATWPALDERLLAGGRGVVPAFPAEVLPPAWRAWAADRARGLGAPIDYVAQGLLAAVAGGCGAGVEIRVTPEWSEPLVLWQALVGSCASGAAGVLERLRQMLLTIERAAAGRIVVDTPTDKGPDKEAIAELARIVAANPRGVLLWRDQPSAWLAGLGRHPADCASWRRAWSARPLTLPALSLERFAVGILGTLEPEQLAQIDGADPGLAARFLYAWPQPAPFCPFGERRLSKTDDSTRMLQRIEEQARGSAGPLVLELEDTALAALEKFLARLHRATVDAEGPEAAWLGHGAQNVVRLAAALDLLAWSEGPATRAPGPIGAAAMASAVTLWDGYFRPHALLVLERAVPSDLDRRARRVLRWLKATGSRDVSGEEVRTYALCRTVNAAQAAEILEWLESAGAVRRRHARTGRKGRPAERWAVNPALAG